MSSNLVIATCLVLAIVNVTYSLPTSDCARTAVVIQEDKCCCQQPCCEPCCQPCYTCHKKCGDTIVIKEPDTCCCKPVCVPTCNPCCCGNHGYGYGGYGYGGYGYGHGYGYGGCGCCQPCCTCGVACHKKCGDTIIVKEPDTCCCRPVCKPVCSCCCRPVCKPVCSCCCPHE